ncbi:MAG: exosortase/archaeosortase family protein [Gemmatimonadales bacterium]
MVAPATSAPNTRRMSALLEGSRPLGAWLPIGVAAGAFIVLFANPAGSLVHDWLHEDDAGHGLLLFPVALWLAWRSGLRIDARPRPGWGSAVLLVSIFVRLIGSLAAEFFSQRFSIWLALLGVVLFCFGWRQARHWWLPLVLLALAIPLPALVTNQLAIPLQFEASKLGTALIHWRHIPVRTTGNVIQLPNATLFVAEACSGLRSLSALIALGVMIGGMYLRTTVGRLSIIGLTIPLAILLNGLRIFLTAFLVYFVSPELGHGFMHTSEGFAMFIVALACLASVAAVARVMERRFNPRLAHA